MKLKEIVKAIIAWFTLPFLLANAKMLLPLLAVAPFMIGMTMVALMNEYKRSYDIDYEDKAEVLEGVDANNNGMRDDLERFGEEIYKDWNPIVMRAYHNWLKNLYSVMKKRGNIDDHEKIKYLNSLSCWVSLQDDKRLTDSQVEDTQKNEFLQIAGLAFNTRDRELYQRKDFIFDLSLNADSFYRWIYQCADIGITDQQIFKFQKFELKNDDGTIRRINVSKRKYYSEKPELYKHYVDFNKYKDNLKTRKEVYEEFYKYLDDNN